MHVIHVSVCCAVLGPAVIELYEIARVLLIATATATANANDTYNLATFSVASTDCARLRSSSREEMIRSVQ